MLSSTWNMFKTELNHWGGLCLFFSKDKGFVCVYFSLYPDILVTSHRYLLKNALQAYT